MAYPELDLEEEIKRQKALATLSFTIPPAEDDPVIPRSVKEHYGDWEKWPSLSPEEAVDIPAGHIDLAPPQIPTTREIRTDPETGTRFAIDKDSGRMVPRAELATLADEQAFKPSDVQLPQLDVTGEVPVRRGELVKLPTSPTEPMTPGPSGALEPDLRPQPVQPAPDKLTQVERATLVAKPRDAGAVKLPVKPAPDQLTQVEKAKPAHEAAPGTLTQVERALPSGPKAPGTHTELAPPGQMDLRPDELPAQKPVVKQPVKPASDDWRTWITIDGTPADPSFIQPETKAPTPEDTLKVGERNRVDPRQLFSYLRSKFADSGLVGYVPPDGARWGIYTGSAAEWAAFGLAVAKQESDLNTRSYNASDPGGSIGLFQFGQGQTQFTGGGNQFEPQESANAFVRAVQHYVANKGSVANLGATFGSIRRPNEAGQYIGYAQEVAAKDSGGALSAPKKEDWESWATLLPEEQSAAEATGQKRNIAVLDKLNQSTQNPGEFWRKISQHIDGVPDDLRQQYADNWKKDVVKNALSFYGEKDPEKAFSHAVSDPGFETYVSNVGRGLAGAVGQADVGIALMGKNIDNNRVDGFAKLIHPESTGEGRAGFIKTLTDIADTRHRHNVFNEIYGNLPQVTKDAIGDPASILDSIDHLASPQYQADLNKAISIKKAWVDQQLAGDPSLRGTSAAWWTTGTGENIFNTVAALVPGGIGAIVRDSTLGAQIYSSNMDRIAQEHPSWSSAQVSDEASRSAFMQLAPQEVVMALSHGITAPLLKWVGAAAQKPIVRFGIGGGVQVGAAAVGGAAGQMGENVIENKPFLTNVPQAAGAAVVQALPFAVHGGLRGVAERPRPEPVGPTEPELGVHGPPELPRAAVTRSDVLGTQEGYAPEPPVPWYKEGVTPAERHDPLVIRGAERTTFTPQELADLVDRAPSGSPADLADFLNRIGSPTGLHLGEGSKGEIGRAKAAQEQPSPIQFWKTEKDRTRAEQAWIRARAGEPLTLPEAIAKSKAEASLGGASQRTSQPVQSFTTAKGSTYEVHEDGTTTRNKAYRPEHGTAEQGPQERSHRTIYVTPADAQKLGEIQTKGGPAGNIEQASNGQWGVRYREGKDAGKFERRTMVNHQKAPAKGLIPVELWDKGKRVHFGNEITEIRSHAPGSPQERAPHPRVSESEPFVSKIANRYTAERMASGELGHVDPSQGKSTEELIGHGLQMTPAQREGLIDNFVKGKGGDLDEQGAAIRSKEALLSVQSTEAARAAEADPTNRQLKAQADAALKAVTDFHNGPVKKLKRVWSDAGRGLQRDVPLDYTTLNGIKEAYIKGRGNGKEAPPEMEPKLKQAVESVKKSASQEQAAIDNLGKEIEKKTRGKILPNDDHIRAHLMEIMKNLPCRN